MTNLWLSMTNFYIIFSHNSISQMRKASYAILRRMPFDYFSSIISDADANIFPGLPAHRGCGAPVYLCQGHCALQMQGKD